MCWPQRLLIDRQCASEEVLSLRILPLTPVERRQVIEICCHSAVFWSPYFLMDRQGAPIGLLHVCIPSLHRVESGQGTKTIRHVEVLRPKSSLADSKRPLI